MYFCMDMKQQYRDFFVFITQTIRSWGLVETSDLSVQPVSLLFGLLSQCLKIIHRVQVETSVSLSISLAFWRAALSSLLLFQTDLKLLLCFFFQTRILVRKLLNLQLQDHCDIFHPECQFSTPVLLELLYLKQEISLCLFLSSLLLLLTPKKNISQLFAVLLGCSVSCLWELC